MVRLILGRHGRYVQRVVLVGSRLEHGTVCSRTIQFTAQTVLATGMKPRTVTFHPVQLPDPLLQPQHKRQRMEAGPPGEPGQAAQGLVELVQEREVVSALGLTKLYMDSTAPGTRIRPRIAIQITVQWTVCGQAGSRGHVVQSRAQTELRREQDHAILIRDIREVTTALEQARNHSYVTRGIVQLMDNGLFGQHGHLAR